ncbi:hypothetical protein [Spirosoma litoris]
MKQLELVLKHKWFDMIESGNKLEEYRDIKPYWIRRLITPSEVMEGGHWEEFCSDLMNPARYDNEAEVIAYFDCKFIPFASVRFRRGYQKKAKTMIWDLGQTRIDNAKPEWAEGYMNRMFVIPLIKRIA